MRFLKKYMFFFLFLFYSGPRDRARALQTTISTIVGRLNGTAITTMATTMEIAVTLQVVVDQTMILTFNYFSLFFFTKKALFYCWKK